MNPHPKAWRVDIDRELADKFASELDRLGMHQKSGTERLIRTFLAMPADVRALMLQLLTPELTGKVARVLLRELGKR